MRLRTAVLMLLSAAVFGQTDTSLVGTVERVTGNEIQLRSAGEKVTVLANERTQVRKGKVYHDLSPLKPGHEVSVRCDRSASGKLVALSIRADTLTFSGVIERVNPGDILVSSTPLGNRVVRFHPGTTFSASQKDLAEGQQVHVVGLDAGNSEVDATRVTIYNTDLPVR